MLRMDQVHVVRHKILVEGQSTRSVARQMSISRNTIRKYLKVSEPVRVARQKKPSPVMEMIAPRVEEILSEWRERTTAKQRITGTRIQAARRGRLRGRPYDRQKLPPREAAQRGRGVRPAGTSTGRGGSGGLLRGYRRGGRPEEEGLEVRDAPYVLR